MRLQDGLKDSNETVNFSHGIVVNERYSDDTVRWIHTKGLYEPVRVEVPVTNADL